MFICTSIGSRMWKSESKVSRALRSHISLKPLSLSSLCISCCCYCLWCCLLKCKTPPLNQAPFAWEPRRRVTKARRRP